MFIVVAALVRTGALDALMSGVQNQKMRHPGCIWAFYRYACCYPKR